MRCAEENGMVQFVWEFMARADRAAEFESAYAKSGPWAQLFRKSGGFHGTTLLRDSENARRYVTIDLWQNVSSQKEMRERFAKEYAELDRACEAFTESERRIGIFEEL
jgi:quinol monooxygenase YgiN